MGGATRPPPQSGYYGKYRGLVDDNDDPRRMGRIRVRVPELLDDVPTGWALPCTPYAGPNQGSFMVPPVGAGVWVEFESGRLERPIWVGCWWPESSLPQDEGGREPTPSVKTIRSEQGLMVSMDDDGRSIVVSDSDGQNMLEIEVQQGKILIKGATKAVVEAPAIELVDGAAHPVVFGDELLQYLTQIVTMLNTHTHPGELALGVLPVTPAPPVPPLNPPTPMLLSTRVKTG